MIAIATSETKIPAKTSSQKWLPVAITENQTHAGQRAQNAFAIQLRQTTKRTTPTINASAACRLGIAAYGLATKLISPLPWLRLANCESVSSKPRSGNILGGAVGRSTYPTSPITFASRIAFRKRVKYSCRRRYTHSNARPTTVNSEFQYVHEARFIRNWDESTKRWNESSISP